MSGYADKLDKLVPRLCESIGQTFETMVFLPVQCGTPEQVSDGGPLSDVSATIGMSGSAFSSIVALAFPRAVAEAVFRSMMMMGDGDQVEMSELKDAVGELANMVAGGAKATLQNEGMDCSLGLPTVISGDSHQLQSPADAAVCLVPVSTDKGRFYIRIAVA